jgi:uncharacterized protein YjiS (DUF1127 family)
MYEIEDEMTEYLRDDMYETASIRDDAEHISFIRRWISTIITNWRRRKMIGALEALDDRVLDDIGVNRGDIPLIVDGFDSRELRMTPVARRSYSEECEL